MSPQAYLNKSRPHVYFLIFVFIYFFVCFLEEKDRRKRGDLLVENLVYLLCKSEKRVGVLYT